MTPIGYAGRKASIFIFQESGLQADTHAFIVRIWQEDASGEGQAVLWRGSIEAVGNGPRQYFSDLQAMVRFIQEQLGQEANQPVNCLQMAWSRFYDGVRAFSRRLFGRRA